MMQLKTRSKTSILVRPKSTHVSTFPATRKQHEFLLPDYMVHPDNEEGQAPPPQHRRGKHTQTQKWKPAPFAMDYDMPFQNEGHNGHPKAKAKVWTRSSHAAGPSFNVWIVS